MPARYRTVEAEAEEDLAWWVEVEGLEMTSSRVVATVDAPEEALVFLAIAFRAAGEDGEMVGIAGPVPIGSHPVARTYSNFRRYEAGAIESQFETYAAWTGSPAPRSLRITPRDGNAAATYDP
jgi:hypothetical protein